MKQLPLCLALVLLLSACSPAALQNTSDTADTPVEVTDCGEYIVSVLSEGTGESSLPAPFL